MPIFFLPLLILSIIACCIEVEVSVPGFPEMGKHFDVGGGIIQLTIAFNFLGFCLTALVYGPLSECFGRRSIMIIGNALLMAGAIGCACAPTINLLLASRFVQGVGASTSAVVVFAMIADVYEGDKAVKFIGMMNSILTTIMALAPVVGGFINEAVGWRGNYSCVALISIISWISLLLILPETKKNFKSFDLRKMLIDYRKLSTSAQFIFAALVPSLLYAAYMAFVTVAPFLYMETFELPTMTYALHQAAVVGTFCLVSFYTGKINQKMGGRNCVILGQILCLVGALALVIVSLASPHSPYLITILMMVFCMGFAVSYPVIFAFSLEIFPEIKGTASSAIMSTRAFLIAVLVGLTAYFYNGHPLGIALMILMIVLLVTGFLIILLRRKSFR